jgi:hypothetical protein
MNNRNNSESKDLEENLKDQWNVDRMNHLRSTGRVLNGETEETYERPDEQEADIVDVW